MPHHTMRIVEKKKQLSILASVKSAIYSVISQKTKKQKRSKKQHFAYQ
jgi:hypothetical protein|tara:strand:+ start:367 stop:510 length:144 start_codon:yes stop_codon:yes gene_type:complete